MIDDVMAGILVAPAIYGPALIGQEFSDGKQKDKPPVRAN